MNARGEASTILIVVLALAAIGLIKMPDLFDRDGKLAQESQEATESLIQSQEKQGASVAASVVQIGTANTMAPESPAKAFISREVPLALSQLPAPDAMALNAAEQRRFAVMEGRLQEANQLYLGAHEKADKLTKDLALAIDARRKADVALIEVAAAKRAAEKQRAIIAFIAICLLGLWVYAKLMGLGPRALGQIAADIRSGSNPIAALDSHVPDWLKSRVRREAKLAQDIVEQ
jgi:hypothetical protein